MADVKLDEAVFEDLFARVITPALAPHEAERRRLVKRFWNAVKLGGAIAACVVVVMMLNGGEGDSLWFGFTIVGGFAGVAYIPVARFEKRCKTQALTHLAEAIGMTYQCDGFEPPRLDDLATYNLIESWEDADSEDLFSGTRGGCDFQLYEPTLTRGSGKEQRTVFKGQVIRIAFPKRFLGTTVVNRDGVLRWTWGAPKLERVRLESSQFERIFQVFGDDQVEARYLVHPVFMEKLMALEAANAGKNIRCLFHEGDLVIAIEGSDLFEVVEAFKPLPNREQTKKGVDQIAQVLTLIDAVMAQPPRAYG